MKESTYYLNNICVQVHCGMYVQIYIYVCACIYTDKYIWTRVYESVFLVALQPNSVYILFRIALNH